MIQNIKKIIFYKKNYLLLFLILNKKTIFACAKTPAKGDVLGSFQLLVQVGFGLLFDSCPNFPLQNRDAETSRLSPLLAVCKRKQGK